MEAVGVSDFAVDNAMQQNVAMRTKEVETLCELAYIWIELLVNHQIEQQKRPDG